MLAAFLVGEVGERVHLGVLAPLNNAKKSHLGPLMGKGLLKSWQQHLRPDFCRFDLKRAFPFGCFSSSGTYRRDFSTFIAI